MKFTWSLLAPVLLVGFAAAQQALTDYALAQTDRWLQPQSMGCQPDWQPAFGGIAGTGGVVRALAVFDDGSGAGPALYVGGWFTSAGGTPMNRIAKWNGTSWSTLASGLDSKVWALTVFDDGNGPALYAAGEFTTAGGIVANHIAKWDGSSWSPLLSGTNSPCYALTVFDDGSGGGPALYVAGKFTVAGAIVASRIAKWNGTSWSALGSGVNATVGTLTVFDDGQGSGPALYAGGGFTIAGGGPASRIARWDGTSWSHVGNGLAGGTLDHRSSMTVFDDGSGSGAALYFGGDFTWAGGTPAKYIAKWDGANWSPVTGGTNGPVFSLAVFDDGSGPALYAGGKFTVAGSVVAYTIGRWDGANWSPVGSGCGSAVKALGVFDDGNGSGPALFVGGDFIYAGGVQEAFHIASWNGTSWSSLGSAALGYPSSSPSAFASTVFDDGSGSGPALYIGGWFAIAGGVAAENIAKWDGTSWTVIAGTDAVIAEMTVFDDGSGGGPALYVGGWFTNAGGTPMNRIAKWDGTSWSHLGGGIPGGVVHALAFFDDGSGGGPALYAGGQFTSAGGVPANHIARWDGSSWSPLGTGVGTWAYDSVDSLMVFDDGSGGGPALYVGGDFPIAGGVAANNIAKWDGSTWSSVGLGGPTGSGINGNVYALKVFDDSRGGGPALYAGGDFSSAGGVSANNVAKWDGTNWSPLGSGTNVVNVVGRGVQVLTAFDDGGGGGPALYAAGYFTTAGGVPANSIAKWDGATWSSLESEMTGSVLSLTVFDDSNGGGPALFAGGSFYTSASADSYVAKWGCSSPPPVTTFCTAKTMLVCGAANINATGTPSATASNGFIIEARPVRGCRAGLLLYSNQPVQPGASFGGPGNGLLCISSMGLRRAGPIESGGTNPSNCDGILSIDMNRFHTLTWAATGCSPAAGQNNPAGFLGNMGTTINAQIWGRDSTTTGQVLRDGIRWSVGQ